MNGKDTYDSILAQARKEDDPKQQNKWVIEILDMVCANHLPHIESEVKLVKGYLKKVSLKMTWVLIAIGVVGVFLLLTHPEVLNLLKLTRGV